MKKGISPVIATVILVAVTLVIAVAIVGWLFGLWGGLAGGSPSIQITNQKLDVTSAGNTSTATLELYIRNTGGGSDKILKAELISGNNVVSAKTEDIKPSTVISANYADWFTIPFDVSKLQLSPGDTVIIKIYFEKSGTQTFQVTVLTVQ